MELPCKRNLDWRGIKLTNNCGWQFKFQSPFQKQRFRVSILYLFRLLRLQWQIKKIMAINVKTLQNCQLRRHLKRRRCESKFISSFFVQTSQFYPLNFYDCMIDRYIVLNIYSVTLKVRTNGINSRSKYSQYCGIGSQSSAGINETRHSRVVHQLLIRI